jgi:hypothetical protein
MVPPTAPPYQPSHGAPPPHAAPSCTPSPPPPSPSSPSPLSSPWPSHGAPTPDRAALPWRATQLIFLHGITKTDAYDIPLVIPTLNFIRTNSNLRILRDFVFQLNSDFISNSNRKAFGLLPHPYISLGAPPTRIPMPIPPQN